MLVEFVRVTTHTKKKVRKEQKVPQKKDLHLMGLKRKNKKITINYKKFLVCQLLIIV